METVWAVNPGGVVVALTPELWDNPRKDKKGRKFEYGWRAATEEEIAGEKQATVVAKKAIADKKIVKTLIVNEQPITAEALAGAGMSYQELKEIAKEKGIKTFGKKKEVLAAELGL